MAVHVLAVLAYKEGDPVTSSLLAGSVNTNPVIIRRLLLTLKRARLIDTRKGSGAGSRLTRSPQRINLAEIYRAVESHEAFSSPSGKPNAGCPVGHCIRKTLEKVFASAENALERDLEKTTLADVVHAARETCLDAQNKTRVDASKHGRDGALAPSAPRSEAQREALLSQAAQLVTPATARAGTPRRGVPTGSIPARRESV